MRNWRGSEYSREKSSIQRQTTLKALFNQRKQKQAKGQAKKKSNTMSSNRTTHRQQHDEQEKQQQLHHQQQQQQSNATNSKSLNEKHRRSHEECDIIGEIMGNYGKYQFYMTFLLSLFQIPNTFHISSPIYQVSTHSWYKIYIVMLDCYGAIKPPSSEIQFKYGENVCTNTNHPTFVHVVIIFTSCCFIRAFNDRVHV